MTIKQHSLQAMHHRDYEPAEYNLSIQFAELPSYQTMKGLLVKHVLESEQESNKNFFENKKTLLSLFITGFTSESEAMLIAAFLSIRFFFAFFI
jgi:hypothetical protein